MKVRKSVYYNYYYSDAPLIPASGMISWEDMETSPTVSQVEEPTTVDELNANEEEKHMDCIILESSLENADNLDVAGLFPPQLLDTIKTDQELYDVFVTFLPEQNCPNNCEYEPQSSTSTVTPNVEQSSREHSKRRCQEGSGDKLVPCKKAKTSSSVQEKTGEGGDGAN